MRAQHSPLDVEFEPPEALAGLGDDCELADVLQQSIRAMSSDALGPLNARPSSSAKKRAPRVTERWLSDETLMTRKPRPVIDGRRVSPTWDGAPRLHGKLSLGSVQAQLLVN